MVIEFDDGRLAHMYQAHGVNFRLVAANDANIATDEAIKSDYFGLFIKALVEFFDTGVSPVPHSQTIDVIAVREAGLKAMKTPFTWVEV